MKATTVMLPNRKRTWCLFRPGRKVFKARKTTIISRQYICRHCSRLDKEPYTELEASVITTFLLEVNSSWTRV